jgi:hypothetical protein
MCAGLLVRHTYTYPHNASNLHYLASVLLEDLL